MADTCNYGNEPSGSAQYGEFLNSLTICQLLKQNSAPWTVLREGVSKGSRLP